MLISIFSFFAIMATAGIPDATPQPSPDAAVNTIAISNAEQLAATLTLANHNTLLFFPTLNSPDVRVVALAAQRPNGLAGHHSKGPSRQSGQNELPGPRQPQAHHH